LRCLRLYTFFNAFVSLIAGINNVSVTGVGNLLAVRSTMNNSGKKRSGGRRKLYAPVMARILDVVEMTPDVKLFRIEKPKDFSYSPGQFLMVSVWGAGEVPISITSTEGLHREIELCIRKVGLVTSSLHNLMPGDLAGIRGPLGNSFPFEAAMGKDILFVAGGIGLAPLRSLVNLVLARRSDFGRVAMIYGSRCPSEVLFQEDLKDWAEKGMDITLTVDRKEEGWKGKVGLVTEFLGKQNISIKTARAFICGPHIMIKNVMRDLSLIGMPTANIVTTLEAHMKCGVGKCGHCYMDGKYICTDGPVFEYPELKKSGAF
jgi:sulfhydrogenase subunit gamma (sulfur reductase)